MFMSLHEQSVGATDEWYTPPYVFEAMGCRFDMDVASPGRDVTPWIPARQFITRDSLNLPWSNFIWMNAPFGARNGLAPWLDKIVAHGDGIALTPDRTSAPWWQRAAFRADCILFVTPKIRFRTPEGGEGASPAQGTSLMAFGDNAVQALTNANDNGLGQLLWGKSRP